MAEVSRARQELEKEMGERTEKAKEQGGYSEGRTHAIGNHAPNSALF